MNRIEIIESRHLGDDKDLQTKADAWTARMRKIHGEKFQVGPISFGTRCTMSGLIDMMAITYTTGSLE